MLKKNVESTFEPCVHACVNIKYMYKNTDKISIFVFESGSIIITGAKTRNHILEAYKFITKVLYENYNRVLLGNVDNILERADIKQLLNITQKNNKNDIVDGNNGRDIIYNKNDGRENIFSFSQFIQSE